MPLNETSALLLKNHCDQQYASDCNHNYNAAVVGGYHAVDEKNHIVYVNKDITEYEPIFCLNEYTSSLTLDELLPYTLDPWWQNLRRILFLAFWLILLLTFATACLLSYLQAGHTSCNVLEKQISASSNVILAATTSFPTTIAEVLSTQLLGGK